MKGKAQLGKVSNAQRELFLKELRLRGAYVDPMTKIKKNLMKNECPGNEVDWKWQTNFNPKLFTAPDWSKDDAEETLRKLDVLRCSRVENDDCTSL